MILFIGVAYCFFNMAVWNVLLKSVCKNVSVFFQHIVYVPLTEDNGFTCYEQCKR
jgi:hypothetical protein